jgi:short-chain 2-methylacyl-CoA dehydrogenase
VWFVAGAVCVIVQMDPVLIKELFANGLMGIEIDPQYGGLGLPFCSSIIAIEEISKVDPSVGVLVDIQNTLTNTVFTKFANRLQRETYLPRLATGNQ